mmetsp:Transcript_23315/g.64684  ORF Transcript_23315/g.64684 Transcript_23315/m.64684 type:complete len:279 (-) Transcript_23315:1328-2164(-)
MNRPDVYEVELARLAVDRLPLRPSPDQPRLISAGRVRGTNGAEEPPSNSSMLATMVWSPMPRPPKLTSEGLVKKLGTLALILSLMEPILRCFSHFSARIRFRSRWTHWSRVISSATWLLMVGMCFHVWRSAASIHSLNSGSLGLYNACKRALKRPRWPSQGMRETSQSRPSYSWVKICAPIVREVACCGAYLLAPTISTACASQDRHWFFKNINIELARPVRGVDQMDFKCEYDANITAWGLAWLMMKWLTLNISLSCCIGRSCSMDPSENRAPSAHS